jgi:hypothetical protein
VTSVDREDCNCVVTPERASVLLTCAIPEAVYIWKQTPYRTSLVAVMTPEKLLFVKTTSPVQINHALVMPDRPPRTIYSRLSRNGLRPPTQSWKKANHRPSRQTQPKRVRTKVLARQKSGLGLTSSSGAEREVRVSRGANGITSRNSRSTASRSCAVCGCHASPG